MAGTEAVDWYPWAGESFITGNLAVGNVRANLLAKFTLGGRVHADTLLFATGALAGFAAQNAVWKDRAAAGLGAPEGTAPGNDFVSMSFKNGDRLYFGDHLNAYIVKQPNHDKPLPIWALVAGRATTLGLAAADLPSLNDMFSHAAKTAGSDAFGVPRVSEDHRPHLSLVQALAIGWPFVRDILSWPLPEKIQAREAPLRPQYWPIVLSVVAGDYMVQAKAVVDARTAVTLVMEGAISGSKMDPSVVAAESRKLAKPA
jgi:hypothetical protein